MVLELILSASAREFESTHPCPPMPAKASGQSCSWTFTSIRFDSDDDILLIAYCPKPANCEHSEGGVVRSPLVVVVVYLNALDPFLPFQPKCEC